MKASIVLGLGFGDEGKGATVNSLITKDKKEGNMTCVVRFSGGNQAGHTVMQDGVKHIHSSFGSGTLQNVETYFTEHCVIDPMAMRTELMVLEGKEIYPMPVMAHPLAMITTPFDVMHNRSPNTDYMEHGTCGMGVGATMKRNETPYKLYAKDLKYSAVCKEKLRAIAKYYEIENREYYITAFMNDLKYARIKIENYDILEAYDHLIFEGSQGIMLDMEHGIFPNVTYANTTSKNALEVCVGFNVEDITIWMVTRCYQTRHGNGWMSNEDLLWLKNAGEETNVTGEWQGEFRKGELDYDLLNYAIDTEEIYSSGIHKNLIVTCLDQREGFIFDASIVGMSGYYASKSPEGIVL